MSNSLQPYGLQHTRFPCSSPSPGVCSNSCPLSQWCHPTISSCVRPFCSCLQSFPASGSFPVSQLFTSDGQSVGALASILPVKIQDWFPLGWTGLISLQSKGFSWVFSGTTVQKHPSILLCSAFFMVQLSHPYMTIGKINMLSRLVIAFLPRYKDLLISFFLFYGLNDMVYEIFLKTAQEGKEWVWVEIEKVWIIF